MLRAPIWFPDPSTGPPQSRFGGNKNAVVGIKRFADEFLGHIWPVRVRGVDEINSEFGKTLQRPDGFCPIQGRPLNARAGYTHRPKTEAVDLHVTTDIE